MMEAFQKNTIDETEKPATSIFIYQQHFHLINSGFIKSPFILNNQVS